MLEAIRTSSQSWWIRGIFIFLILSFVAWGVGSALMTSAINIATVDGIAITQDEFLQRLQQEKDSLMKENPLLTDSLLEQLGIRKQVFDTMVTRRLLLKDAERIGVVVTDRMLRETIMSLPLFKDAQGKFDANAYKTMLQSNKVAMVRFEDALRADLLIQQLATLITGSAYITNTTAKGMYTFLNEERSIEYIFFPSTKYINTVSVSPEERKTYYEANKATWTQPQRVRLSYIPLTQSSISRAVSPTKEQVENYYTANNDKYASVSKEEAYKTIHALLLEQQVKSYREDIIDTLQSLRAEGKNLKEIANTVKLTIETTELLPIDELEEALDIPRGTLITRVETVPTNTIIIEPIPLQTAGESLFVEVVENIPTHTPSLQEVESDVEYVLRTEKALVYAKEEAQKILQNSITTGKKLQGTKSEFFPRFNPPLELPIRSDDFITAVFKAQKNEQINNVFTTTQGAVLVTVTDILSPAEADWNKTQKQFTAQLQNVQGDLLFRAYQAYLHSKATIVISNPAILEARVQE